MSAIGFSTFGRALGWLAIVVSMWAVGCGSAERTVPKVSASHFSTKPRVDVDAGSSHGSLLNDGDAEKIDDGDEDNREANHEDHDADSAEEYEDTFDNGSYRDADDANIVAYGRPARGREEKIAAGIALRYYTAARRRDGARACAMMSSSLAKSAVKDYGRAGPPYLRDATTCAHVAARLFDHYARALEAPAQVTGVRVSGQSALALIGSATMPAGSLLLRRERGAWRVAELIANPLP